MTISVKVENLKELAKQIRDLGDADLKKQLREANKAVAQMVVRDAIPRVPVYRGRLRATVKASATQTAAYGKAGTPARTPYAAAIHWGTGPRPGERGPHNIKARRFLWDAADSTLDRAIREYEDAVNKLIDRIG